jgi:hypothetical protein
LSRPIVSHNQHASSKLQLDHCSSNTAWTTLPAGNHHLEMTMESRNMKTFVLVLVGITLLFVSGVLSRSASADNKKDALLRHVVLFKFKAEAKPEQIDEIVQEFQKLPKLIPQIQDFECGTDISPEKLSNGYKHCFIVTFANEEDRDTYLRAPAHLSFVAKLKPILDDALVVDYWVK